MSCRGWTNFSFYTGSLLFTPLINNRWMSFLQTQHTTTLPNQNKNYANPKAQLRMDHWFALLFTANECVFNHWTDGNRGRIAIKTTSPSAILTTRNCDQLSRQSRESSTVRYHHTKPSATAPLHGPYTNTGLWKLGIPNRRSPRESFIELIESNWTATARRSTRER